jgi:hypothetical protein
MQLLERLSCLQLPAAIREATDIEKCEVLRNAAFIEADLPPMLHGRGTSKFSGQAIVMKVTEAGIAALPRSRTNTPQHFAQIRASSAPAFRPSRQRMTSELVRPSPTFQLPRID